MMETIKHEFAGEFILVFILLADTAQTGGRSRRVPTVSDGIRFTKKESDTWRRSRGGRREERK